MVIQTTRRTFVQGPAATGVALNLKYRLADDVATVAGDNRGFEDLYRRKFDETPA